MKKIVTLTIAITCFIATSFAQNQIKCVYLEEAINRADQPDKITQDEFVLFVEGNHSAFYSRNAYIRQRPFIMRWHATHSQLRQSAHAARCCLKGSGIRWGTSR